MSKSKPLDIPNVNNFKVPEWAGKPPAGLHLDVMKDEKMIQKLMIDEKSCYLFGRNRQMCDFPIDHQSCSRVHSALIWHKDLHRPFLIDCGSVHGTYIGSIRLEAGKPQQIPIDSKLHFGASTRVYVIRERISNLPNGLSRKDEPEFISVLPEDESELDNLTEFNTAQNRRNASVMNIQETNATAVKANRKQGLYIHFSDQEEIINPEDVDPTIGRFRNLVQETFIPNKRLKLASSGQHLLGLKPLISVSQQSSMLTNPLSNVISGSQQLSQQQQSTGSSHPIPSGTGSAGIAAFINPAFSAASKMGLNIPNLAADISEPALSACAASMMRFGSGVSSGSSASASAQQHKVTLDHNIQIAAAAGGVGDDEEVPRKKKYAKEAWPGKKPVSSVVPLGGIGY